MILPLFALAFVTLIFIPVSVARHFSWDNIKYVYAFGDSYSFVQGTRGHANFSFIGDKLDFAFTPQELLTMRSYLVITDVTDQTSSEGSNWLEFLTGCFQGSPFNCPKQLWNFAFAGADIDGDILPLHHDFTIPLVDQVTQWLEFASTVIPHPENETLTSWWIGINDTGDSNHNTSITDFTAFWEIEMQSYFKAVDLASRHGLKAHLFLNVPPGERSPASSGNPGLLKDHIQLFNSILVNHIDQFTKTHPDNFIITFDTHTWFNQILDHPEKYGFQNVTGFCTCVDPSGYFWYDSGHPTQHVYQLLAEAIQHRLGG